MKEDQAEGLAEVLTEKQASEILLRMKAPHGTVPMGSTIRHPCIVNLSKDEHLQVSQRMADLMGTVEDLRNQKARIGAQIKEADAAIVEMCNVVKFGRDLRDVACHQFANFETREVATVRLDTGEIVKTRAMDHNERQLELDLEPEQDAAEVGDEADEGGEE